MLTIEPEADAPPRSLESVCRKLVSVAPPGTDPPSEPTRFWKLCCNESSVEPEEVEVAVAVAVGEPEVLDESWVMRLCTSLCI